MDKRLQQGGESAEHTKKFLEINEILTQICLNCGRELYIIYLYFLTNSFNM